jgi:hypothetical protein
MTSRGTQPLTLCTYESETILIDGEYECLQAAKDLWIASVVDTKKIVGYVMNDDDTPYCRHVYLITTHRKTQAILTRIKCCLHEYYLPKKDKCISSYRYTTVQEE